MCLPLKLKVPGRLFYVRLRKVPGIEGGTTSNKNCPASGARPLQLSEEKMSSCFLKMKVPALPLKLKVPGRLFYVHLRKVLGIECGATLNKNCPAECAAFMQKMLFVAVLLCDFYANCANIMQVVLFLCKL